MTGYGKAVAKYADKTINVEVKTLNSKALDISTRIASSYREKEMDIRKTLQQSVIRGKVDFILWVEKDSGNDAATINIPLAQNYLAQLLQLHDAFQPSTTPGAGLTTTDAMTLVLRMPDVMSHAEAEELTDEEWHVACQAIDEALQKLHDFRAQEGAALRRKFEEKLDNIAHLMTEIEPFEQSRVEKIRQRLTENLKTLPEVEYDKNRLEQELIYYIEKLDISEEKQRLANHLQYFRTTMDEEMSQGKKLGFIAQEMGREINTTGSKSNQAEMQNIVVQMKDELEQIKEQVLNAL